DARHRTETICSRGPGPAQLTLLTRAFFAPFRVLRGPVHAGRERAGDRVTYRLASAPVRSTLPSRETARSAAAALSAPPRSPPGKSALRPDPVHGRGTPHNTDRALRGRPLPSPGRTSPSRSGCRYASGGSAPSRPLLHHYQGAGECPCTAPGQRTHPSYA